MIKKTDQRVTIETFLQLNKALVGPHSEIENDVQHVILIENVQRQT